MGMSIDIWGPAAWSFLTSAAFAYGKDPEKATSTERMHAKKFFETLPYMLPCSVCRDHYLGHLKKHPVDVTNRDSLSRWIVKIHNIVNVNNGKPVVPYEKVREHYMGNAVARPERATGDVQPAQEGVSVRGDPLWRDWLAGGPGYSLGH